MYLVYREIESKQIFGAANDKDRIPIKNYYTVLEEIVLVTLHVKSLYTNIPVNEGIKAVNEAYVITIFVSLILTLKSLYLNLLTT